MSKHGTIKLVFEQHMVSYSAAQSHYCMPASTDATAFRSAVPRSLTRSIVPSFVPRDSGRPMPPSSPLVSPSFHPVSVPSPPSFHSIPHPSILVCFFIHQTVLFHRHDRSQSVRSNRCECVPVKRQTLAGNMVGRDHQFRDSRVSSYPSKICLELK